MHNIFYCAKQVETCHRHLRHVSGIGHKWKPRLLVLSLCPVQDDNIYDRLMSYSNKGDKLAPPTSPLNRSTTSSVGPLSPNSVVSAGRTYSRVKVRGGDYKI